MAGRATARRFPLLSRWDRYRATALLVLIVSAAVSPLSTLGFDGLSLLAVIFIVTILATLSPVQMSRRIARHHQKLAEYIARSPRAEVGLPRKVPNAFWRLALSVLFWPLAAVTAAEAAKAATAIGGVFLFLLAVILTVITGYVLFDPKSGRSLVLGEDGLRVGDGDFIAFAAIERLRIEADALVIVRHGGEDVRIELDLESAEVLRRQIEQRTAKPRAEEEERAPREAHFRVADAPHAALVSILRDGSQSLPERVRVAEVLSVSAPDELERFALETADPELEKRIAPLARR